MHHDGSMIRKKRYRKKQTIKSVIYIVLMVLVYCIVLLAQIKIEDKQGIKLFGYEFYTISSSSMEPEIKKGDIIIIKQVPEAEIYEKDIITFKQKEEIVTHRVQKIENKNAQNFYLTKGDNNQEDDPIEITYESILGKKVGKIANLGNIILFLNNKIALIFMVLVIILILMRIRKASKKSKMRREKKKSEDKGYLEQ